MPRVGRAAAPRQHVNSAVEKRQDFLNTVDADKTGGQFNGKSNSFKPATHFTNDGCIGVSQFKLAPASGYPLDKQFDGRESQCFHGRQVSIVGRTVQWI